jgi:hypothetical protein
VVKILRCLGTTFNRVADKLLNSYSQNDLVLTLESNVLTNGLNGVLWSNLMYWIAMSIISPPYGSGHATAYNAVVEAVIYFARMYMDSIKPNHSHC